LLGVIAIIVFELTYKERYEIDGMSKIPCRYCLLIGVFQSFSVIPGLSRSAPTIMGGLFLGMKRQTTVLYSFLLAVPTMIAASGYDLVMSFNQFSGSDVNLLLVGFLTAFIVAMLSIKFFLGYVRKHNFIPFGIYRILLVAVFYFFVIL